MNRLVGTKEAAALTGLSVRALQRGVKSGRYPVVQESKGGKLLFDIQLLAKVLADEAMTNVKRGRWVE